MSDVFSNIKVSGYDTEDNGAAITNEEGKHVILMVENKDGLTYIADGDSNDIEYLITTLRESLGDTLKVADITKDMDIEELKNDCVKLNKTFRSLVE